MFQWRASIRSLRGIPNYNVVQAYFALAEEVRRLVDAVKFGNRVLLDDNKLLLELVKRVNILLETLNKNKM